MKSGKQPSKNEKLKLLLKKGGRMGAWEDFHKLLARTVFPNGK